MIYDPQYVSRFYDSYSNLEWDRLEKSAYGRLQALMHTEMLGRYCHKGYCVLDAGCGPGRFSIEAAKLGARVTAFDISPEQLRIAREKIVEAGFIDSMDAFVQGDVSHMDQFSDGDFDLVLAFGGALSYVRELRYQAASELVRVM
jgi:ubiquinone/menaquinone biosynthesis C-methylase UbiE